MDPHALTTTTAFHQVSPSMRPFTPYTHPPTHPPTPSSFPGSAGTGNGRAVELALLVVQHAAVPQRRSP